MTATRRQGAGQRGAAQSAYWARYRDEAKARKRRERLETEREALVAAGQLALDLGHREAACEPGTCAACDLLRQVDVFD